MRDRGLLCLDEDALGIGVFSIPIQIGMGRFTH